MVEWSILLTDSIQVIEISFPSKADKSARSSKFDGRPLPGLSFELVSPDLKRANHSLHRLSLIVPSLKSSLNLRNVFRPFSRWYRII
ncbi:hypothetical protein TNIN_339511 [Trichonephila inaurata madagascariensis]|uniref:Uncharacterized protein n=1 Tax=Trichonephila inaurata madagascariensis TaxID=2747483 RepID=A0A8X7C484_9ARAC|nr:hypothetical protein TNIN_339511 [Trichonephila inaurata madagascariensis]